MLENLLWTLVTLGVAFTLTQTATVSTSVYLHRSRAHHSLEVHPVLDVIFRAILWITTGQKVAEWVAVHRKHHTFTDKEGDPHSPHQLTFWKVQLGNVYYYIKATKDKDILFKYARDIKDDIWDQIFFNHGRIGPLLGIIALWLFMGWWGLIAAFTHLVLYVFVVAPIINGLCHWSGQKNFDNTAFNRPGLSRPTGGESLHNNHHAFPASPKFSYRPSEYDPSWSVIKLLEAKGLVTIMTKTIEESLA